MSDSNRIEELEKRVERLEETVILLLKWEQERLQCISILRPLLKNEHFWY